MDVSGELMGNLADQGRDKGNVFLTDFNSGLWVVKVRPAGRPAT